MPRARTCVLRLPEPLRHRLAVPRGEHLRARGAPRRQLRGATYLCTFFTSARRGISGAVFPLAAPRRGARAPWRHRRATRGRSGLHVARGGTPRAHFFLPRLGGKAAALTSAWRRGRAARASQLERAHGRCLFSSADHVPGAWRAQVRMGRGAARPPAAAAARAAMQAARGGGPAEKRRRSGTSGRGTHQYVYPRAVGRRLPPLHRAGGRAARRALFLTVHFPANQSVSGVPKAL